MEENTVQIGQVTIRALQDLRQPARPSLMFSMSTPEKLEPFKHFINERGHFAINIGSFAVRSAGQLILVDTGIGDKNRPNYRNGRLPDALAEAGIAAEEVDIVLNTHMHIDHIGWNTVAREGRWVPLFPKARYIFQRREWEYWTRPELAESNPWIGDSALPLQETGQVDLIEDVTAVTSELTTVPTPGHTPGHVSIAIVSNGEKAFITGDVAHHPVQFTEWEWSMGTADVDPELARRTRLAVIERLERDGSLVAGTHFPLPGFGRMGRVNGMRIWQPVLPLQS
jgi:glyoxylase-like metal-dependent hydrolase (beta-lactamase superfamily II)